MLFDVITLRKDVRKTMVSYFDTYLTQDMCIYDIGCGDKPFSDVLSGKVKEHIGVDIEDGFYDKKHIDLIGSAYAVPVEDGVADVIISTQVIEHLERPQDALQEAARILKKDGLLLISFPFLYPIHADPQDFTRFTEFAMEGHLKKHGFSIVEQTRIGGFWYIAGIYLHMYLKTFDRSFLKKFHIIRAVSYIVLWIMTQIHRLEGFIVRKAGKNPQEFRRKWTVNYVLVARKIS